MESIFRYDLASTHEPRVILITDHTGKRSEAPRLGYVVLPQFNRRAPTFREAFGFCDYGSDTD